MNLMKSKLAGGNRMGRPMDISLIGEDYHKKSAKFGEIHLERV